MHGILFNPINEKNMECVASDGIRIAYYKFDYEGASIKFVADPNVIEFANSLLNTTKNKTIDFYIKDRKCALFLNNTTIIFNLYENNYQNIISPLFNEQKYSFTVKFFFIYVRPNLYYITYARLIQYFLNKKQAGFTRLVLLLHETIPRLCPCILSLNLFGLVASKLYLTLQVFLL